MLHSLWVWFWFWFGLLVSGVLFFVLRRRRSCAVVACSSSVFLRLLVVLCFFCCFVCWFLAVPLLLVRVGLVCLLLVWVLGALGSGLVVPLASLGFCADIVIS